MDQNDRFWGFAKKSFFKKKNSTVTALHLANLSIFEEIEFSKFSRMTPNFEWETHKGHVNTVITKFFCLKSQNCENQHVP